MDDLHLFLALRLAADGAPAQRLLCQQLRLLRCVRAVAREGLWPIHPSHWRCAEKQAVALRALAIHTVPAFAMPRRLVQVVEVPALFVRGDKRLLQWPAVAIVGARHAAAGSQRWAGDVAFRYARRGELVVSGGARGVDAASHRAALAARAPTLAYVGTAIDAVYPPSHKPLFARILQCGGAIVSEHPPRASTFAFHHAARNRLIAAHADDVIVVEAAAKSGSLGTATWAHRYGRRVWVAPHEVGGCREGIDYLLERGYAALHRG